MEGGEKKQDKRRDKMKKKREDEMECERANEQRKKRKKRCSNPPDELAQHVSKKSPSDEFFLHFSSKVQNLTVFSIMYMICCECMRWDDTYTHVFCARRRPAGFVSHMFTHALTVYTRNDTVRLNYDSRFVRVIYSSQIVSIKLNTVTPLRRCGLAVHER